MIKVTLTKKSILPDVDFKNLKFGETFSDHILIADYSEGEWNIPEIVPYDDVKFKPSVSALHYGQSIFEGFKAYRFEDGQLSVFRPDKNFTRFNKSAIRMSMPEISKEIFINGMKKLVEIDQQFIPDQEDSSLYIRPFMFSTDNSLAVRPSQTYRFIIITSPVGKYYSNPLKMKVETNFSRASEGGVGFSKNAGNYAASLYPAFLAQKEGFDQLIWTDSNEHSYIEEAGIANLLFVSGDTLVVPDSNTVLQGITRDSIIEIAKSWGINTEIRKVKVSELTDGIKEGRIKEAFAAGTAATISHIQEIQYKDQRYLLGEISERTFSNKMLGYLNNLRYGRVEDPFGWNCKLATKAAKGKN